MTVFDLQLSLSHRDPSQRESLPTNPRCEFKSEAQAATYETDAQGETKCVCRGVAETRRPRGGREVGGENRGNEGEVIKVLSG